MNLTKKLTPTKLILEIVMVIVILCYLIPLWMVVANSLKNSTGAGHMGLFLPAKLLFENYTFVIKESNVLRGLYNGLLLGAVTVTSVISTLR